MEEVLVSWSGGKDSALALSRLLDAGQVKPAALLTSVTQDYDRISMHGVRRRLLEDQAAAAGLPLAVCELPAAASNATYEERWTNALRPFFDRGIRRVMFGDIFLRDIRSYREQQLARMQMTALFPLWDENTTALAEEFFNRGFRAVLTCVDTEKLPSSFAGAEFARELLPRLPAGVDPCGENGEFHTFVYEAPFMRTAVPFSKGEVVIRDERFAFCDLVPRALL